jgi:RNA polymerase sigma factor (sigma-70 family)
VRVRPEFFRKIVTFRVPTDGIDYHILKDQNDRPNPTALLEAFIASGHGEREFTGLVRELGGLVYSSALRRTQNTQLAEEVMQNVFALLARKAKSLRGHPSLTAWLHETTRLEASSVMRAEKRSQRKAAALAEELKTHCPMTNHQADSQAHWKEALPLLDEALDRLSTADRQAIFDRFYEGRQYKDIAARNGQSEAAAKMRITRALTKLSGMLTSRGVTLSATVIASALGTELARSAPLQVATLVAPKALAASSSISTTTILTNTILTMSSTKTTSLTAAAVIALAAIPFSQQAAEARRMEAKIEALAPMEVSNTKARIRPPSRMTAGMRGARTPSSLLASLNAPKTSRDILRDLCSFDSITSELARQRVAGMTNEERAELLGELWRFPCGADKRTRLLGFIVESNGDAPPDMMLDQLIKGGHYQAFSAGLTLRNNPLTLWAKKDPAAAVKWYEQKLAGQDLTGGLGDQNFRDLYLHLMPGLVASDPDKALDIYAKTPGNFRDVRYGMFWPVSELGSVYANRLAAGNGDAGMRKLLEMTAGPARALVVSSAAQAYADAGKPDEALAFVDRHNPQPWKRSDFPELDYGNHYYNRDGYVREIANASRTVADLDTNLDWLLANISKPEAATLTVMGMLYRYDEFGQQAEMTRWLNRQPSGKVRDAAHASLVWQQTMAAKYDAALEGTSKIDDPSVRSQMVKIIEDSRQLHKDTGGARKVFQASSVPKIKF